MQDEVNEKVVSLAIKTSKLTAGVLQSAIKALLKKGKGQLTKAPHGKVTMRQLMKPGEKVTNIEITDANIKAFDPIAKKNGLTYNVKKIENGKPPTYLVSFRGKDIDVMTEAFREFSSKKLSREQKPSIRKALAAFRDKAKQLNANREKVKKKERGIDRLWVVILNAKGNEFPRTGITNLPHLFFYTTNHDKPQ